MCRTECDSPPLLDVPLPTMSPATIESGETARNVAADAIQESEAEAMATPTAKAMAMVAAARAEAARKEEAQEEPETPHV